MKRRISLYAPMSLAIVLAGGCATQAASKQLSDARAAYQNASAGPAAKQVPNKVHDAGVALQQAERAHERDAQGDREIDLAYIAERKALLAQQAAEERIAHENIEKAEARRLEVLETQRDSARTQLSSVSNSLESTSSELEQERRAREKAEKEAQAALESLNRIATIRSEQDRTVISLSGEVLFETNKAALLPIAKDRLDSVAKALEAQGDDKTIEVVGYTDSRGSDAYNEKLSRDRAESVRAYLLTQGLDGSRVAAVGRGESSPIASNDSPEGRANNRRVEIVIEKAKNAATSSSGDAASTAMRSN